MAIQVINDKCRGCKLCIKSCPFEAITMEGKLAVINEKCTACNQCIPACPFDAIIKTAGNRLCQQPAATRGGGSVALTEPGTRDHRRSGRSRDRGELDVQPPGAGVAERGPLLGIAVDLTHGVIDIEERDPLRAATGQQSRHPRGKPGQQSAADLVELLDMAVGEGTQERAQRRGRPNPGEQPIHPAVAQQVEVIDGVRTGEHPADDRGGLRRGVGRGHRQALEEVVEAGRSGQPQRRYQTCGRHQIRVIEHRSDRVRRFHLRGASRERLGDDVAIDIFPAQEGTSFYATLTDPTAAGGSGVTLWAWWYAVWKALV